MMVILRKWHFAIVGQEIAQLLYTHNLQMTFYIAESFLNHDENFRIHTGVLSCSLTSQENLVSVMCVSTRHDAIRRPIDVGYVAFSPACGRGTSERSGLQLDCPGTHCNI